MTHIRDSATMTADPRTDRAAELVDMARTALAEGRSGDAFDFLDKAVSNTADPGLLEQIHELASRAHAEAGFVARHTKWGGLVRAVEGMLPHEDRET